jgi:hypothetical protein
MTLFASATHPHNSAAHEGAIEALAREAHVPIEQVAQLCAREWTVLTAGARITDFLTILTTRKVREILRQGHHPVRTPAGVDTLRKIVQSGGSAIAQNQCGTGEEQRRCVSLCVWLSTSCKRRTANESLTL